MYRMGPRQRGQAAHQWTAGSLGWRKGARRPAEVGPLDLDTINPPAARHAFLYPAAILANCGCRFRVSRLLCGKLEESSAYWAVPAPTSSYSGLNG